MMYRYLYEALDNDGDPCILFDASDEESVHARLRAYSNEDKTNYTARFYRRLEADTKDELDALEREIEAKWIEDTAPQSASSAPQSDAAPTPQNHAELRHGCLDSAADAPHSPTSRPIAGPNVAARGMSGAAATGRRERPLYIYNHRPEAARAHDPTLIDEKITDYYRFQGGFAADLNLVMVKMRLGPTALGRLVGVDRSSVLRWKAGTTLPTDPVVFLTVILVAARVRGGRWGWQR